MASPGMKRSSRVLTADEPSAAKKSVGEILRLKATDRIQLPVTVGDDDIESQENSLSLVVSGLGLLTARELHRCIAYCLLSAIAWSYR
jgi:hypothetical protein